VGSGIKIYSICGDMLCRPFFLDLDIDPSTRKLKMACRRIRPLMVLVVSTIVSIGVVVGKIDPQLGLMFILALAGGDLTFELAVTHGKKRQVSIRLKKRRP